MDLDLERRFNDRFPGLINEVVRRSKEADPNDAKAFWSHVVLDERANPQMRWLAECAKRQGVSLRELSRRVDRDHKSVRKSFESASPKQETIKAVALALKTNESREECDAATRRLMARILSLDDEIAVLKRKAEKRNVILKEALSRTDRASDLLALGTKVVNLLISISAIVDESRIEACTKAAIETEPKRLRNRKEFPSTELSAVVLDAAFRVRDLVFE